MRTVKLTSDYIQAADFSFDLWNESSSHPATFAAKVYPRLKRKFTAWTARQVWAEALRIGWKIYKAIKSAKSNQAETVSYLETNSWAYFPTLWNRFGDFLAINGGDLFFVVDLRSTEILFITAYDFIDAENFADGKDWDRQIVEKTWVFYPDTKSEAPSVEAYNQVVKVGSTGF